MSEIMGLKAKTGLDVFKHDKERISKSNQACGDPRLKRAVLVCPAGLYSENAQGEVSLPLMAAWNAGPAAGLRD
jgi:ferredoxin like protein